MHQNSLLAWADFKELKFRSQEEIVFKFIMANPGITRQKLTGLSGYAINAVTGRVKTLLDRGVVFERGSHHNQETGKPNARLYHYKLWSKVKR